MGIIPVKIYFPIPNELKFHAVKLVLVDLYHVGKAGCKMSFESIASKRTNTDTMRTVLNSMAAGRKVTRSRK